MKLPVINLVDFLKTHFSNANLQNISEQEKKNWLIKNASILAQDFYIKAQEIIKNEGDIDYFDHRSIFSLTCPQKENQTQLYNESVIVTTDFIIEFQKTLLNLKIKKNDQKKIFSFLINWVRSCVWFEHFANSRQIIEFIELKKTIIDKITKDPLLISSPKIITAINESFHTMCEGIAHSDHVDDKNVTNCKISFLLDTISFLGQVDVYWIIKLQKDANSKISFTVKDLENINQKIESKCIESIFKKLETLTDEEKILNINIINDLQSSVYDEFFSNYLNKQGITIPIEMGGEFFKKKEGKVFSMIDAAIFCCLSQQDMSLVYKMVDAKFLLMNPQSKQKVRECLSQKAIISGLKELECLVPSPDETQARVDKKAEIKSIKI